ncbi:hypothetical protein TIFTF001_034258 [Ficus carica]|uniref:Uncharacterized protein n=1 Tax=Ficus carica TaxID=3494 RepID=A0AA88J4W5_FICCA|nr:hypothetical protein TIFTF001_034258 [Ficus carica]
MSWPRGGDLPLVRRSASPQLEIFPVAAMRRRSDKISSAHGEISPIMALGGRSLPSQPGGGDCMAKLARTEVGRDSGLGQRQERSGQSWRREKLVEG